MVMARYPGYKIQRLFVLFKYVAIVTGGGQTIIGWNKFMVSMASAMISYVEY